MKASTDLMLEQLKRHGPQSATALAHACSITPMGAHKQLQLLLAQGLVVFGESSASGVGRPQRIWRLTAAGHGRFPDRHGDLSVQLIRQIKQTLGPQALDRLITAREEESLLLYQGRLAGLKGLAERVQTLAAMRLEEGYMARAEVDGERPGAYLLIEDHCPICAAATECQGFCRSELNLFQRCMGEQVKVSRAEHQLDRARRCAYRFEELSSPA
ncbi:helix-turn-helix transcriptional regulator [Paucibacter sp. Y2R2-4]|uniref:helix-turn-helix transcriptional regulator n=1 Tax=Paucibacter sp. Y2R2-4 TaxID=2893553 RepID=UPI0021E35D7F|nr:MarR family transcriptional regulator [Paucibacter sp. Y2R2-4]MCV2352098.1 MarR family transcriptional regulator [Paucibacter sp. Y2R2-4]